MKNTILKVFAFLLITTICFTSCQKEVNNTEETNSQKVIEKTDASINLKTFQLADKTSSKIIDKTVAVGLDVAKSRASAGARALGCGALEIASTKGTGNSYNPYGFNGEDEFYDFEVSYDGTFVIDLFGLAADLDVFLLKKINGQYWIVDYSTNYNAQAERMISNLDIGSYAILVDAYNAGITSAYKLTVKCLPQPLLERNFLLPELNFNDNNVGEKVAETENAFLRFNPNQTDDAFITNAGNKNRLQVLPGMDPILYLSRFEQDQIGLGEARVFSMRIPQGKNARFGVEKSVENGVEGTCLIDLESDGSIWFRIQGKWHKSSKRYPQGEFMEIQFIHYSEGGEYAFEINQERIAFLTSDLQVEASDAGIRDFIGISLQTFNQNSEYEIEEIYEWAISPAGGPSRVKKETVTIEIL